eukprot:5796844-Prymnesium_polylepis.2
METGRADSQAQRPGGLGLAGGRDRPDPLYPECAHLKQQSRVRSLLFGVASTTTQLKWSSRDTNGRSWSPANPRAC